MLHPRKPGEHCSSDQVRSKTKTVSQSSVLMISQVPKKCPRLEAALADDNWTDIWRRTGVLGKTAIIQSLWRTVKDRDDYLFDEAYVTVRATRQNKASSIMEQIITLLQPSDLDHDFQVSRVSASLRLTAFGAQIALNSSTLNLPTFVFRYIYEMPDTVRTLNDQLPDSTPFRGAVIYAALTLDLLRKSALDTFADPVILFNATLVLWYYAKYGHEDVCSSSDNGSSLIDETVGRAKQLVWIKNGAERLKIAGIGTLGSMKSRSRLLEVSAEMMGRFTAWRLSSSYRQILLRLRSKEQALG